MALHRLVPIVIAGVAWPAVAGYGYWTARYDSDDWEGPYMLYTVALIIGASVVVGTAAWLTRDAPSDNPSHDRPGVRRPRRRRHDRGMGAAAVDDAARRRPGPDHASAERTERRNDRSVGRQLNSSGLRCCSAGIAAEVGRRDSYGDYPAAVGIALVVTAAITVLALVDLATTPDRRAIARTGAGSVVPSIPRIGRPLDRR